jgi:Flp pilus assembly pilin Flp
MIGAAAFEESLFEVALPAGYEKVGSGQCRPLAQENWSMFGKFWERIWEDEGQGVSEYAMLLVLLVLIIVAAVHALGANAQQVIDRVNTALHG